MTEVMGVAVIQATLSAADTTTAIIFFMGHGVDIPTLVICIGALNFAIMYTLFMAWNDRIQQQIYNLR